MCSPLFFFTATDLVLPNFPVFFVESDSQGVGKSIEVIHDTDDGSGIHDIFIGKAMTSELFQVFRSAGVALQIDLIGEFQKRSRRFV
jgi:hypothetical protein